MTRAPRSWHSAPRVRAGYGGAVLCYAPGCFGCFYDRFNARPLDEIERERAALESCRPRLGHAWPDSNYFRALTRVCADRRDGSGTVTRQTEGAE